MAGDPGPSLEKGVVTNGEAEPLLQATEARTGAWEESRLVVEESAPRLAENQPPYGLVWVTRGRVTVVRGNGAPLELPKGSVVAYRLGDALTWAAAPGTHVRWCERDVRVREGEARPWTPDVRGGEGGDAVSLAPRRRPWMAVASIALLWTMGVTVAWCVSASHGDRVAHRIERTASPETLATDAAIRKAFEDAGFTVHFVMVQKKSRKTAVAVATPTADAGLALAESGGALRPVADALKSLLPLLGVPHVDVLPAHPRASADPIEDAPLWESTIRIFPDGRIELVAAPR